MKTENGKLTRRFPFSHFRFHIVKPMKYFPHTANDLQEMLKVVGVGSLEELYSEIPEELIFNKELNLPSAMSEIEVR